MSPIDARTNRATTCNEVAIRTLHHWWKGTAELAHVFEGMHAAKERRSSAPASLTSLYRQRLYRLLQLTTDDVSRQIHDGALQWDCWRRSCLRNRLKLLLWAELKVLNLGSIWMLRSNRVTAFISVCNWLVGNVKAAELGFYRLHLTDGITSATSRARVSLGFFFFFKLVLSTDTLLASY